MKHCFRRSFVLVAVLVIVASALFVATSTIFMMQSNAAVASGSLAVEHSRSLAWSGLQVVIEELNSQRDLILDGDRPQLESEYIVFDDGLEMGVVRLLPVDSAGELLSAEAGKVDINSVDAETLERIPLVEPSTARDIIKFRDEVLRRPFQSIAELLQVEGVTPEMVYGPLEDLRVLDDSQLDTGDIGERLLASYSGGEPRGLADILTVFAFEPALQRNGKLRINLNVEWSDELHDRLVERFNKGLADGVKEILESDFRFESDRRFFDLLMLFAPQDPGDWVQYIDAFTFEPHDYLTGRVDLNTASYDALLSLPSIEPEQAEAIVERRDSLGTEERATVAWCAIEEVLEPRQYQEIGGLVTTRCWNWRVRVAAGTVASDEPDAPLQQPVIYEAVVDLSGPRARIAYLRDITQLQTAAFIATNATVADQPVDRPDDDASDLDNEAQSGDSTIAMPDPDGEGGRSASDPGSGAADGDRGNRGSEDADMGAGVSPEGRPEESESPSPSAPRRVGRWKAGG